MNFNLLTTLEGSLKRSRKRTAQQTEDSAATYPRSNSAGKRINFDVDDEDPNINPVISPRESSVTASAAQGSDNGLPTAEKKASNTGDRADSHSNIQALSFILHPVHETSSPAKRTSLETTTTEPQPTEVQKACLALGMTGASVSKM